MSKISLDKIESYNNLYKTVGLESSLSKILEEHTNSSIFASSLGAEDQVLLEILLKTQKPFQVVTLDTGRLFNETYTTIDNTEKFFQIKIKILFPDAIEVSQMVSEKGINLFYDSIENRKLCCKIRKLNPLGKELSTSSLWITGVRREQSVTRSDFQFAEWDENYQVIKINPLIDWTETQVWDYIKDKNIPYNELHDKGFPSIGCAPCTRAVLSGEDTRSGRWWWENPVTKECGLHWKDGKLVRVKS
ncbi:MAG: phosphoadenylyl-sulfate reductase [Leptospiraceae bacterium]|nr:phosphoadenylyl-sulfate reductase [Leptospiraceae bacterium]